MSYGPGYTMWQEILRERAERRHARYLAKRAAAMAKPAAETPTARKRGRPRLKPDPAAAVQDELGSARARHSDPS